jgi:hypothetical protein
MLAPGSNEGSKLVSRCTLNMLAAQRRREHVEDRTKMERRQ